MVFPELVVLASVRDMGRMLGDADTDDAEAVGHPKKSAPVSTVKLHTLRENSSAPVSLNGLDSVVIVRSIDKLPPCPAMKIT